MSDLRSELAAFDENWGDIQLSEGGNYENLPDGKYQAAIEEVGLEESKASGRAQVKWVLRVLAGEYQGRCIFRYNGIANFDQVTFLKKDLHTCGLDLAKLSDLEDRIDELVGVVVEVTLKTKGEYQNCYINKQVKVASATERAAADADASLPW